MRIDSRQEDLSIVFDKTWKANHNNDVEAVKKKEKEFIDKLFDVKPTEEINKPLTPNDQVERLQKNMKGMSDLANMDKLNSIKDKF